MAGFLHIILCKHYLYHPDKFLIMRSLLYIIAVIMIIGWLLGVFVYSASGLIHILIVLAVIALILGIIRRA
jgi:hypothetical protein